MSSKMLAISLLSLGFFLGKSVLALWVMRRIFHLSASVETNVATSIAEHLFSGNLSEIAKYSKAELQWATTGSSQIATSSSLRAISQIISDGSYLLILLATLFAIDWASTLLLAAYFLFSSIWLQWQTRGWLNSTGEHLARAEVESIERLLDLTRTFREARLHRRLPGLLDRFARIRSTFSLLNARTSLLSFLPRYVLEALLIIGLVLLGMFQIFSDRSNNAEVTFAIFIVAGLRVVSALNPLQTSMNDMRLYRGKGKLALNIQDQINSKRTNPHQTSRTSYEKESVPLPAGEKGISIHFENVSFSYPDAPKPSLRNVSFSIEGGDHVAVVGSSGAGKSSLVNLILGLETALSGSITLDGMPVDSIQTLEFKPIGYMSQSSDLLSGTIAENVTMEFNPELRDENRLLECLEIAELGSFVKSLPRGVDQLLDPQQNALSGGEKQRIELARALYHRPRLLVLDEATNALDRYAEKAITRSLRQLGRETTLLIVAHSAETIRFVDFRLRVSNGKVSRE